MQSVFLTVLCMVVLIGCRRGPTAAAFDVPSLLGQDIDAITASLGKPSREENQNGAPVKIWTRDGVTLSVSYKTMSKRATAFTLISSNESSVVREEGKAGLLGMGKLSDGDTRYSTELIEVPERPLFYNGITVLPTPKTHAVVLRVTAASALLEVNYQITGGSGGQETFMTLAPWEKNVSLPDDSKITLSSRVYRSLGAVSFWMKTEIVVDGKVVVESKTSGVPVSCEWEI